MGGGDTTRENDYIETSHSARTVRATPCVGINTFLAIMLLALTTNCDGGALLTRQGTHICLILSLILCGGHPKVASPHTRLKVPV